MAVAIALIALGATARTVVDTTLTMSDGVAISTSLFLPDGDVPAGGHPAIVSVHGFGGSRRSNAGRALLYADSGYVALTFSVRGQGYQDGPENASGGVTGWLVAPRVVEDVAEIYRWLAAREEVRGDRIAIEGISQGGLITWGALLDGIPFRCAVPIASVPVVRMAFASNGTHTYFTVAILNLAKSSGAVRFGPFLDSLRFAYEQDAHATVMALLDSREISLTRADTISVPIFSQLAWNDDIFAADSLIRILRKIKAPMKLTFVPGGHGMSVGGLFLREETFRFYRHWLRDDQTGTVMDRDSLVTSLAPTTLEPTSWSVETFSSIFRPDDSFADTLSLYFQPGGALRMTPPSNPISISRLYVQNLSDEAAIFRTDPLTEDLQIAGASFTFSGGSTVATWQTNILLFDVETATGRRTPITRGAYQARDNGETRSVTYRLAPRLYTIKAGHQLQAEIHVGMPLIKPAYEFGKTPFAPQMSGLTTFGGTGTEPMVLKIFLAEDRLSEVEEVRIVEKIDLW